MSNLGKQQWFINLVDDIKAKNVIFWVGAGISRNPPSSLPLGNELKFEILTRLCYDEDLEVAISEKTEAYRRLRDYPLEAFLQTLEDSDIKILPTVQKIYSKGEPS